MFFIPMHITIKCDTILNQSYNATLFYFDNFFAKTCTLDEVVRLNKSSLSKAFEPTLVLTMRLKQFKKQTILLRKGS